MSETATRGKRNLRTALKLSVVFFAMFGFSFALVPLYDLLCCLLYTSDAADE